jgi:DNA repair protein RadC
MDYISIKNWSSEDQPREKLMQHGPSILSDAELVAILIGSGTREISAVELSRKILSLSSNNLAELGRLSVPDLMKIKGIGEAKAITIVAALELGRRRAVSEPTSKQKITSSLDAASIFLPLLSDIQHEEFWVAYLNRSNTLIERTRISIGGISGTVTDVRLILRKALEVYATSIILSHNHPSGNLNPSEQDKQITQKIKESAKLFDLTLLDHIVIGTGKYYSFADEGQI